MGWNEVEGDVLNSPFEMSRLEAVYQSVVACILSVAALTIPIK